MSRRTRYCVECPKCRTRYVVAVNRYPNGSCLIIHRQGCNEEYDLYCSCASPATISRWSWRELRAYWVPGEAYVRGYGSPREIVLRSQAAT
jgi:hypothetical protein